ncbi:dynein light intermediate chain-domain-containing protein [Fimicolochytrium jonesii]|uniref:dynein light intermediate chain-domain-containing protein n=1 Tax=Fimicolochytrium jonesii TaxID=1396493 RepID=UPI0022FEF469|nr:dynein light intermediate chain-domain-containing protein [Fimicolochytrium jonesii]KAI8825183.1 dynein light intermediate chain-domain-containing protein [Fimicolochytrium jonesii]
MASDINPPTSSSSGRISPRRPLPNGKTVDTATNPDAQGTAAAETEGIWDTILKSVATTKVTQTKKLLVVGDAQAGKTTVINAIKQFKEEEVTSRKKATFTAPVELALSYNYMDVTDEENEDVIARVGIYQLASDAAFENLMRFALSSEDLADALVVIVMDWTRPWTFVRVLGNWLSVIERHINKLLEKEPDRLRHLQERVEAYYRGYREPAPDVQGSTGDLSGRESTTARISAQHPVETPLDQGVLTKNLGIPIVFVAAKSDATTALERDRGLKEEHFDFIQQTLRTLSLKYGASLFYTSTKRSDTLDNLRSYILHRLFYHPGPSSGPNNQLRPPPTSVADTSVFQYTHRPQVVDRDTVAVPCGWDSWGKIRVLREGFDCAAIAEGESPAVSPRGSGDGHIVPSSKSAEIYETVIPSPSVQESLLADPTMTIESEQTFLERHLEILQTTAASSPRGPNRSPSSSTTSLLDGKKTSRPSTASAGNSQASVKVKSAAASSPDDAAARLSKVTRRDSSTTKSTSPQPSPTSVDHNFSLSIPATAKIAARSRSGTTSSPLSPPATHSSTSALSTASSSTSVAPNTSSSAPTTQSTTTTAGGGGPPLSSQNEVLANFFQSLLAKKTTTATSLSTTGSAQGSLTSLHAASGGSTRGSVVNRGEKEREREGVLPGVARRISGLGGTGGEGRAEEGRK